jgi:hypothetical protein
MTRSHFPPVTAAETGYGVAWMTCRVCNRDVPVGRITITDEGPVCDECHTEWEWTRYGTEADDRGGGA